MTMVMRMGRMCGGGLTDGESAWREVEAQAAAGREQGLVGAGKTQVS